MIYTHHWYPNIVQMMHRTFNHAIKYGILIIHKLTSNQPLRIVKYSQRENRISSSNAPDNKLLLVDTVTSININQHVIKFKFTYNHGMAHFSSQCATYMQINTTWFDAYSCIRSIFYIVYCIVRYDYSMLCDWYQSRMN